MTVAEQRTKMIDAIARVETNQTNMGKDIGEIKRLQEKQNDRVRKNSVNIARIVGIGTGIAFLLGAWVQFG